jgi:hypothetical protein
MTDPDEAEQSFPASDPVAHWSGVDRRDARGRSSTMSGEEPKIDPQDRQFGAAAARDQEREEQLEERGVDQQSMPDETRPSPRAGAKATPAEDEASDQPD